MLALLCFLGTIHIRFAIKNDHDQFFLLLLEMWQNLRVQNLYSYCLPGIVVCPVKQWLPSTCCHGGVFSAISWIWCTIYRRIQLGLTNCLFLLFWTKGWWNCSHHLQAWLRIWKKWSTTWDTTWVSVLSLDIWEVELEIRVSRQMAVTNKWDSVPLLFMLLILE